MSKKIWYSKTLTFFWDKYHKNYEKLGLDPASLLAKLKYDIHRSDSARFSSVENEGELLGTDLWFSDYTKNLTHLFFVERSLKDFLRATRLADLDGIKRFLKDKGTEQEVVVIKTSEREKITIYSFAIHVPYEKDGYTFSVGIDADLKLVLLFNMGNTVSAIPEKKYEELTKEADRLSRFNAETFRLAINTLAYINCYPECVSDGAPRNVPDDYEDRSPKTISISDDIQEGHEISTIGRVLQPHFRKGHFKLLKSERYTLKRGQIIFVRQTMVNGLAKTIQTAEDMSRLV